MVKRFICYNLHASEISNIAALCYAGYNVMVSGNVQVVFKQHFIVMVSYVSKK